MSDENTNNLENNDLNLDLDFNFDEELDLEEDDSLELDDDLDLDLELDDDEDELDLDDDLDLEEDSLLLDDDLDLELDDDLDLELDDEITEFEPTQEFINTLINKPLNEWEKFEHPYTAIRKIETYYKSKQSDLEITTSSIQNSVNTFVQNTEQLFCEEHFSDIFILLSLFKELVDKEIVLFGSPIDDYENIVNNFTEQNAKSELLKIYKRHNEKISKFKDLFNTIDFDFLRNNLFSDCLYFKRLKEDVVSLKDNQRVINNLLDEVNADSELSNHFESSLISSLILAVDHLKKQIKNDDYKMLLESIKSLDSDLKANNKNILDKYNEKCVEVEKLNITMKELKKKNLMMKDLLGEYKELLNDTYDSNVAILFYIKHQLDIEIDVLYLDTTVAKKMLLKLYESDSTYITSNLMMLAEDTTIEDLMKFSDKDILSFSGVGEATLKRFKKLKAALLVKSIKHINSIKNQL